MRLGLGLGLDAGGLSPKLLDQFAGATAAYSLRDLSLGTTNVVRVRRSSDHGELDFTAAEVSDGTMLAWVTAESGTANGFVTTWYDQSGSGNDATQATAGHQPKLVSSGSLITDNGLPAIDFDGTNDYLSYAETSPTDVFTGVLVAMAEDVSIENNFYDYGIDGGGSTLTRSVYSAGTGGIGGGRNVIATRAVYHLSFDSGKSIAASDNQQFLLFHSGFKDAILSYFNGVIMTGTDGARGNATDSVTLGCQSSFLYHLKGKLQEVIFYRADKSSDRTAIEANINAHYSIY